MDGAAVNELRAASLEKISEAVARCLWDDLREELGRGTLYALEEEGLLEDPGTVGGRVRVLECIRTVLFNSPRYKSSLPRVKTALSLMIEIRNVHKRCGGDLIERL